LHSIKCQISIAITSSTACVWGGHGGAELAGGSIYGRQIGLAQWPVADADDRRALAQVIVG
jgi:hypothetical protein